MTAALRRKRANPENRIRSSKSRTVTARRRLADLSSTFHAVIMFRLRGLIPKAQVKRVSRLGDGTNRTSRAEDESGIRYDFATFREFN